MSILITGGAGYIGSHVVWSLLDRGEVPVVLDNLSTGIRSAVPSDIPFYKLNINDQYKVKQVLSEHKIKSVMHFAGSVSVNQSIANPLNYYQNNTYNSQKLVETCLQNGVESFIFSSTAAVYGTPISTLPVTEDMQKSPQSPYGYSKMLTENMLNEVAQAHEYFDVTALRYFNVAGADPKGRTGQSHDECKSLIKLVCETAIGKRDQLDIYGMDYDTPDGTCIRDFIHVTDLANAHLAALDKMHSSGGSMVANCGYGHGYSVLEIVKRMSQIIGAPLNYQSAPRRPGDIVRITADNQKLLRETDWQILYDDLDVILSSALKWEQHLMELGDQKIA